MTRVVQPLENARQRLSAPSRSFQHSGQMVLDYTLSTWQQLGNGVRFLRCKNTSAQQTSESLLRKCLDCIMGHTKSRHHHLTAFRHEQVMTSGKLLWTTASYKPYAPEVESLPIDTKPVSLQCWCAIFSQEHPLTTRQPRGFKGQVWACSKLTGKASKT